MKDVLINTFSILFLNECNQYKMNYTLKIKYCWNMQHWIFNMKNVCIYLKCTIYNIHLWQNSKYSQFWNFMMINMLDHVNCNIICPWSHLHHSGKVKFENNLIFYVNFLQKYKSLVYCWYPCNFKVPGYLIRVAMHFSLSINKLLALMLISFSNAIRLSWRSFSEFWAQLSCSIKASTDWLISWTSPTSLKKGRKCLVHLIVLWCV